MAALGSSIPAEVRERVVATANELYEQSGRERFPTVDTVRRISRADMNAVSMVMREWREAQRPQISPIAVAVPEVLAQAQQQALATVWMQATELANQNLRSKQAEWEARWAMVEELRQQGAAAFDELAGQHADVQEQLSAAKGQMDKLAADLAASQQREAETSERAGRAEARADELANHAEDLRRESDAARAEAERTRIEQARALEAAREEADRARSEKAQALAEQAKFSSGEIQRLTDQLATLQAAFDRAQAAAAEAREQAANLTGQLESSERQNAALIAAMKPGTSPQPGMLVQAPTPPVGGA